MSAPTELTVAALAARIAAGELSAWDTTQAHLDHIRSHDGRLRAFHTSSAGQRRAHSGETNG